MIIVLGSIGIHMKLGTQALGPDRAQIEPDQMHMYAGGKGANQALAAARSGASVSLVSKIGTKYWGEYLLDRLRRDGIKVSGVAHTDLSETSIWMDIADPEGQEFRMIAPAAATEIDPGQIPLESMNERTLLLVQTEAPFATNLEALSNAKEAGALTMMNLSPALDISPEMLLKIDYLVVNSTEINKIAQKLGIEDGTPLKIAFALAKLGALTCIVTQGAEGAVAVESNMQAWEIGALPLEDVVDRMGAEDVYCGTLAACIQAGVEFPEALKRASIAATLTCQAKGNHESYPYLDDIEEALSGLENAKPAKL